MGCRIVVFASSLVLVLMLWLIVIRANKGGTSSAVQVQPAASVSTQVVLSPPSGAEQNWKVVVTLPKLKRMLLQPTKRRQIRRRGTTKLFHRLNLLLRSASKPERG